MSDTCRQPKIAVAALVIKAGRLLIAERCGGKLQDTYAAPGGHLEWMETFENATVRELGEESGLITSPEVCEVVGVDQGFAPDEDHCWVIVFVCVNKWMGEPKVMEPDKQGPWEWYKLDELPENTLEPLKRIARKICHQGIIV